jgi:7-cyano-7-deazaguanine synthase
LEPVAVLASGGLDSSVLLADLAQQSEVYPVYVRKGLVWEDTERRFLTSFIEALASPNVRPPATLDLPVGPLYGTHWSLSGMDVPGSEAPDSAVFLPGRNILLIALAGVWCYTHRVHRIAIGSLGGNPFPDATPQFFDGIADVISQGLDYDVRVEVPYRGLHKEDIIARFSSLPLHLTLTCISPVNGVHCGRCNKCHERRGAFTRAGVDDNTEYSNDRTES